MRGPMIAGRAVEGAGTLEIRSPWDDEVVTEVGLADRGQVESAVTAAAHAAPATASSTGAERASLLGAMVHGLSRRADELTGVIRDEAGKPERLARGEVTRAIETFSFARDEARRLGGEMIPLDAAGAGAGRLGVTRRVAAGPVAAITPFNFPLNLLAHKVAPALAAGCPVVAKPASQTPSAALILGEVAVEAGAPEGAMSVVPCRSEDAAPLVDDPRMKVLSFTGSREVGHALHRAAGPKRILLELGGNAGAIVDEDADLDHAAERLAFGAFVYAGQVCISVQRIYVLEGVYDAFVERLVERSAALGVGARSDPEALCGPLIDGAAADRVEEWIEEALSAGASAPLRGERRGNAIAPTILIDVDPEARVSREEAFGPVVVVSPCASVDEAIAAVNDSDYGLQAAVFSRSVETVMRAFARLEVGGVIHDDASTFRVDHMPYGGVKGSGLGREGLRYAMEEMTEIRHLVLRG